MRSSEHPMTLGRGDEDDSGWQLAFQHAFEVAESVGDDEAGAVQVLVSAHMRRAPVCTARTNCRAFLVGYPDDVRTGKAFRVLDRALADGDAGHIWQ